MLEKILSNFKITSLNAMQTAALDAAKKERDVVLLSPTGSGKTLGFLLPVVQGLNADMAGVQALVIVPSRELAIQIEQVFKQMGTGFKVNCCYGGHDTKTERNNLSQPPSVLIGTPGRLAYHIRRGNFHTENIHTLVLDEFDKALEFGFQEDMSFIIDRLRQLKKRILTSATDMREIPAFTGIRNPMELNFLDASSPVETKLELKYIRAADADKLDVLFKLICQLQQKTALVFCNHREAVERIGLLLEEKGLAHGVFHGGMEQIDRERALIKFRNGSHRLLITTDLASRGLDIPEIEAVVHYQLPATLDVYTHRNGRTARMHASGKSYLLLAVNDQLPPFLPEKPTLEVLPEEFVRPAKSAWLTLYISAGKKDKVN
ncbi:MAG: DEAD/DEAH box helicase, partial [Bacteroidia bacterium]